MKLKEIRQDAGLSLNKLAEKCKMPKSYLSDLERGIKTNPSKSVMDKIADALGKTVSEVFYDQKGA